MNEFHGMETMSLDLAFEVLSHPYRRRILTQLREHNPRHVSEFSVAELLDVPDNPKMVVTTLHHNHLPKLAEAGFIEWDEEANAVRQDPRFEEIKPLIELIEAHQGELPVEWP